MTQIGQIYPEKVIRDFKIRLIWVFFLYHGNIKVYHTPPLPSPSLISKRLFCFFGSFQHKSLVYSGPCSLIRPQKHRQPARSLGTLEQKQMEVGGRESLRLFIAPNSSPLSSHMCVSQTHLILNSTTKEKLPKLAS